MLHLLLALPLLRTLAVACLAGFLACAVPRASVHIQLLCLVTAAVAGWDILDTGDWAAVRRGLESGIIFGAFIPTIMLLRATADESPLLAATRARIDAWSEGQRELWVQAVAHLLGSFLMIGGYVIARSALPAELAEARRVRFAESATRGLGLAICWSPFFVSSAIASQLVPSVPAWQLVVLGLAFAALGLVLSKLFFYRQLDAAAIVVALGGSAVFAVPSAVLVALVIALSLASGLRNLEAIVLVVPGLCAGYLATLGWPATQRALGRVPATLARLSDEVIIISVAMCLGAVIAGSGAGTALSQLLIGFAAVPPVLILAEVALIAGAGFAGVHPMISATLLLPVLAEVHRGIADLVVAYIVVFGWTLSSLLAIWTLPVASSATCFDVPVRRLAFGRNLRFVVAFGVCGCIALAALNRTMMN
ncbi:MAG: hypothetical protein HY017_12545 [Betaproteobacteria bacterium]|nr:hypothetical protein [Betaproteobacteria bacterium]